MEEKTIILKCKVPKGNIGFKDLKRFIYKSHSREFWAGWDYGWISNKHKKIKKTMRKTIINTKKNYILIRRENRFDEKYFGISREKLTGGYKRFNIHFGNYCITRVYKSNK